MTILTVDDFVAVRSAIDLSLDARVVPDDTIALDIYQGAAERMVLDRDPDAETRDGVAWAHIKSAAIFFTAALLAPAIPQIQSERLGDKSYTRQAVDVDTLVERLRVRAEREVVQATHPDAAPGVRATMPRLFLLARGRRGQ